MCFIEYFELIITKSTMMQVMMLDHFYLVLSAENFNSLFNFSQPTHLINIIK